MTSWDTTLVAVIGEFRPHCGAPLFQRRRGTAPEERFEIDAKRPSYDNTFSSVAGLTPVILLEKPMGLNGHQYQIRGTRGGEPGVVQEARRVGSGGPGKKDIKMGK